MVASGLCALLRLLRLRRESGMKLSLATPATIGTLEAAFFPQQSTKFSQLLILAFFSAADSILYLSARKCIEVQKVFFLLGAK